VARIPRRLLQTLLLSLPVPAIAAPFCVQTQTVPPQCIYYDMGSCQQRATQLNGNCSVNANEVRLTPSTCHYCLVAGGGAAECIYVDQNDCNKEARRQQGACIIAPGRPESPTPDPYALTRPSNAGAFGTGVPPGGVTTAPPADALRNPGR
jgi:hypothetical protein